MESIWMAIAPNATSTRVLAMAGAQDTILKARLLRSPSHPRAMASLLEAIALWQGLPIRAALCADARPDGSDSSLFRETFTDSRRASLHPRLDPRSGPRSPRSPP